MHLRRVINMDYELFQVLNFTKQCDIRESSMYIRS